MLSNLSKTSRRLFPIVAVLVFLGRGSFANEQGPRDGVSASAVVRPSGPGTIQGFGASYQWMPSLNGGVAHYVVSIRVPPGSGRAQPALEISYDSGRGDGPLGRGWRLETPALRRRTDRLLPGYSDAIRPLEEAGLAAGLPDAIVDEAGEEIVTTKSGDWFREHESTFVRYRRVDRDGGWTADFPDGSRIYLGSEPSSRIEDSDAGRVFAWLPSTFTDVHNNAIVYHHRSFPGDRDIGQKYLAAIEYGAGPSPWSNFHFVRLEYESRPDPIEDDRPGFPVRTGHRLKRIVVGVHAAGSPERTIRRYEIEYLQGSGVSLLSSITEVGDDGVTALPPHRFTYATVASARELSLAGRLLTFAGGSSIPLASSASAIVDVNADGLPDVLQSFPGGSVRHRAFLNLGETADASRRGILWSPSAEMIDDGRAKRVDLASREQNASLVDFDGDGRADLAYRDGHGEVAYFPNLGTVAWGEAVTVRTNPGSGSLPFRRDDLGVRTVDLDGDHRLDLIEALEDGRYYRVWLCGKGGGFGEPRRFASRPGFDLRQKTIHLVDMNGDGLADLARVDEDGISFLPGLGFGRFGEPWRLHGADGDRLDADGQARARLADVDGDGLTDLVVGPTSAGRLSARLNRGSDRLAPSITFSGLPPMAAANPIVRWADMNGNGSIDLVFADPTGDTPFLVADLGEALGAVPRPSLLRRIDNGRGQVIELTYNTSTRFAVEDQRAGRPWPDHLPFPVPVVSTVTVTDRPGGPPQVTSYRYHNGAYDVDRHEFRGFAAVDSLDQGDRNAPTLVTTTVFDQGLKHPARRGKILGSVTSDEAGRVFTREETTWSDPPRRLHDGLGGRSVSFAHPVSAVREVSERGEGKPAQIRREFKFDDFGNPTRVAHLGVESEGDERIVWTSYAVELRDWLIRLPRRSETTDGRGVRKELTEYFYDDPTFSESGPNLIRRGDSTMIRRRIDLAGDAGRTSTVRRVFDSYGNTIRTLDPLAPPNPNGDPAVGHYREIVYDGRFHRFPTSERVAVGGGRILEVAAEYDVGYGSVTAVRDFDGARTTFGYDPIGRLSRVLKPGDTDELPSVEYVYETGLEVEDGADSTIVNAIEVRLRDQPTTPRLADRIDHYFVARQYSDGSGRVILTKQEAEPGGGRPRAIVQGAITVNRRGKASQFYPPCFSTEHAADIATRLRFENVAGEHWVGEFLVEGQVRRMGATLAPKSERLYDPMLREIATIHPDGSTRRTRYRPLQTELFDEIQSARPDGLALIHRYDGLGRLRTIEEQSRSDRDRNPALGPQVWTTTFVYDSVDGLIAQVDAAGNRKVFERDGLGRVVGVHDPDFGIRRFEYNAASKIVATIDAEGRRTTFTYDGAHRILTEDHHDGDPDFDYDPSWPIGPGNRPDVEYLYDEGPRGSGRLVGIRDRSGSLAMEYDERGRCSRATQTIKAPAIPERTFFTSYQYDSLDRPTTLTYPDGDRASFTYNARNLPETIHLASTGLILAGVEYEPSEHRRSEILGNGIVSEATYDSRARVHRSTIRAPGGGRLLIDSSYSYSSASDLLSIVDQRSDIAPEESRSERFSHDDLHRLIGVSYPAPGRDGKPTTIAYRYDALGNLVNQTSNGALGLDLGDLSYAKGAGPHALTGRNGTDVASYDANGNVVARDGGTYHWNFDGHLAAFNNPAAGLSARYGYDYSGRRAWKTITTTPARGVPGPPLTDVTLYVGEHYEFEVIGSSRKYIFIGNRRIARVEVRTRPDGRATQAVFYDHPDHLGSTALVTDARGQVVAESTYYPFGDPRFQTKEGRGDRGFLAAHRDGETGLLALPSRMLWTTAGRFLSPDPALLLSGPTGSPQALNPYAYAANRPVTHADPDGNFLSTVITLGFAAFDTYQYAVGNLSAAQYAGAMALNGAALLADISTGGMGGGLLLRSIQVAKVVDRASTVVNTVTTTYQVGQDLIHGNFQNAAVIVGTIFVSKAGARYLPKMGGKVRAGAQGQTHVPVLGAKTLTPGEQSHIQSIANKYDTTIDVVGSRAKNEGRNIGTNLPKGKGKNTRSDIDFRIDSDHPQVDELVQELKSVGNNVGSAGKDWSTTHRPTDPPFIRFTPGQVKGAMPDRHADRLAQAFEYWRGGRALEAGRLIFEDLPAPVRPAWASRILRLALERSGVMSPPIEHLLEIAERPTDWKKAHLVFDSIRDSTLELEDLSARTREQELFLDHLFLAENVARVVYNATEPPDEFDEDSGCWVVSSLRDIVDCWGDEEFSAAAWSALCFIDVQ